MQIDLRFSDKNSKCFLIDPRRFYALLRKQNNCCPYYMPVLFPDTSLI